MSAFSSFLVPAPPVISVEFTRDHVTVVRLEPGSPPAVAGYATEALPPGALVPALNASNVQDRAAIVDTLRRALGAAGIRGGRAALVVPDAVAKVSLLRFEKLPPREVDLVGLVKWQVRKSLPFRVEDAQLTTVIGATPAEGGHEVVAALARRDVVQEYEAVAQAAGLQPGIVDLATFDLVNAALAAAPGISGDWLLVHVAADALTLAILRGSDLIFYRHRGADDETTLADVVHQTAMYYEDRLQGSGFSRAVLAGAGRVRADGDTGGIDAIRRELEQRLQTRVEAMDPRPAIVLTDRVSASAALLDSLAPSVGVLLRERVA